MAFAQGSMKRGMESILREIQLLRNEVTKDIRSLEQVQHDHEARLRILEKGDAANHGENDHELSKEIAPYKGRQVPDKSGSRLFQR